ncbi:TonB-dependent receptor [Dyella acidiphila]|uniref:TonB-dependent receptor n=1 Tax=Dyella acidiphila TaxID=2775866 RepID=A0ABR9GCT2_9GAMM|nr:TonB-dependent receptor [Dyella acidiphila]MBE1161849.1 TonB-dependent receptor [Dyella acidiphila]
MKSAAALSRKQLALALSAGLVSLFAAAQAFATDVHGHLQQDAGGAPVANARVSLTGTNYTTTTDKNGNFVFANVPAGSYTVSANVAGFATANSALTVDASGQANVALSMKKVAELKGLTVAANRYDASSMQMDAPNTVNVLSAADLQYTAVHNVAEALGLIPGVNVTNTGSGYFSGIDGAARGEGVYATVRGLPADYDVNLINGVEVAQGMPYSRSVQLSLLPPSGLQTIVMNKTSTADMDGDAIGGTVDFRTPTAFDFAKDTSGSVQVSGRSESRAQDYNQSGLGGGAAADFQTKFGSEKQFGVYASADYDYRSYVNSEEAAATSALNDGSWAFARTDAAGNSAPGYNPAKNLTSIGMDVGVVPGYERRYGGNFSFDWKVDETLSAYLRMTYAYAVTSEDTSFTQLIPQNVTYQEIGNTGVYQPNIGRIAARYWYETNPEVADLTTFQLGADKTIGGWTISPNVFYSFGDNDRPDHVEIDGREDKYSQTNFPYSGGSLMSYGAGGFPYPQLTPALLAQVNNIPSLYANDDGELTKIYSGQRKGGAKLDFRYDFTDGALSSIQFGAKFAESVRNFSDRDWSTAGINDGVTTLGDLGIFNGSYSAIFPGQYNWKSPKVSESGVSNLIQQYLVNSDLDTCGNSYYINNYYCDSLRGVEAVSALYAKATFNIGNLEIIPGFRFEHTDIHNTYWVSPQDSAGNDVPGYFQTNYTHYDEPLPSIFLNYRQGDGAVYRAGLWQSYTRPSLYQLGSGSEISVSDGVTTITRGNPNLKAIKATNLDLSGQWTNNNGGYASLAGFYKHLSHYIYDAGGEQANSSTSDQGTVLYQTPENGGNARVYGLELDTHQKFKFLPDPFDGFGVGFNATRQNTHVNLGTPGFQDEEMQSAPKFMANAEVFYEKNGFSLNLSYHYTSAWLANYDYLNQGASWDDLWIRPIKRLDLHAGYVFHNGLQVDFSISNLANNYSYWAHIGKHNLTISDIVDTGMTSLLTVKYNF